MENLQKIVILCAVLIIGVFIGAQFAEAPIEDGLTQIDPPSMDIDAGPSDSEVEENQSPDQPDQVQPADDEPVACTRDAKACPDGSYVGRAGPDCEFAACPSPDVPEDDFLACSQEAKQCPDGSYVGRVGPNCEFAECPATEPDNEAVVCSPESKKVDACIEIYQPVCGMVQVQCFTTPCNPVPETFSNGCHACRQGNVISYTEGACEADA